jgi:hypothetical protein
VYAQQSASSRFVNMFTRGGLIHFSDNQCKFNPLSRDVGIALSSIFIAGLADDGFHNNQSSCNIPRALLITNAMLLAGTVRATGNWLKETFLHVAYSAVTFGVLNATTDNESVHCLAVAGVQKLDRHNLILGAILPTSGGVTGDVAEDDVRKQLKDACSRRTLGFILLQMYMAVVGDQEDPQTNKSLNSFVTIGGN